MLYQFLFSCHKSLGTLKEGDQTLSFNLYEAVVGSPSEKKNCSGEMETKAYEARIFLLNYCFELHFPFLFRQILVLRCKHFYSFAQIANI